MRKGIFKDLTGIKIGKLTVSHIDHIKEVPYKDSKGVQRLQSVRYWFCRCECGGSTVIRGSHVLANSESRAFVTRSCGCERIKYQHGEKWKERSIREGTAFRRCLDQYKANAKRRGLAWSLTDDQFRELTLSPCYYTGKLPSTKKIARSGEVYVYNGIDRLNSSVGYTVENCVPCCEEVNRMKMDLPKEEFINLCRKIAERF